MISKKSFRMWVIFSSLVCLLVFMWIPGEAETVTYDSVVLIGVDGAGAYFKKAETPNSDRIFADGAITYKMKAVVPTNSGPGWGSMFYGVSGKTLKLDYETVMTKRFSIEGHPSIFRLIKEKWPDKEVASIVGWAPINYGIIDGENSNICLEPEGIDADGLTDNEVGEEAIDHLKNKNPVFLFVQLEQTDEAGHEYGFGSPMHLKAISDADEIIGKIFEQVDENTLFIVTTDHGGTQWGTHGAGSVAERKCTFAIRGKTVQKQAEIGEMELRDIAAIVLHALGIEQPDTYTASIPTGIY